MRIAVVGGYGVGLSMRVTRFPGPGETVSDGQLTTGHGGKGSNQAVAARRLGAEVALLTAVGGDPAGDGAFQLWAREGVSTEYVKRVNDAATMTGFILVGSDGENRISVAPGALDQLTPADVRRFGETLSSADAAIVSLEIPVAVALSALEIAHAAGVLTVLNPAPAKQLPASALMDAAVITPNLSEATALCGAGAVRTPAALAAELHERSGADVVLTLGSDGALLATDAGIVALDAVAPSRVLDTTGAGDAFTAALTVALAERRSLACAARFAAHAGSHTVSIPEVVPALPYRRELPDPGTFA